VKEQCSKAVVRAVIVLLAGGLVAGCGRGPANREKAEALAAWLKAQSYSSYGMFRRTGQGPQTPASPDGLTLGSPNVFAAVGCNAKDLMSLDVFWGDRRRVRPFTEAVTVSVREDDRETAVAEFPEQVLRRVRHTAISVAEAEREGLRLSCVDFAPRGADDNVLVRWFLVENTGQSPRRVDLRLRAGARGEWKRAGRTWLREQVGFASDARLGRSGEDLEIRMGRVGAGERAAAAVAIAAAKDPARLDQEMGRARAGLGRLSEMLEETKGEWEAWWARAPLVTGDEATDDLLDSLLCLVRSHVGAEAIHTGSLRYRHDRAYVRDSYWVQWALLGLGRKEEARLGLDFFHRAWKASGLASYYDIPSGRSTAYGYAGVELPHYLVLMARDAEQLGGVDGTKYWDMVRGCLDGGAARESGLQPMNGDETWLLAAPVRELDDLLDNSWLAIASAEYGAALAERVGDAARAARYGAMAERARGALAAFMPGSGQPSWYAVGRGGDGSLDFSLCPEVFARGVILGVVPAEDGLIVEGLLSSWERLNFGRGIRTHARSATISGGTPGYVLYAAADDPALDYRFNRELARRMAKFASATGCVWEFHDLYDAGWGGEKRRLWDSAVLAAGMTHALLGRRVKGGRVVFTPKGRPAAVELERSAAPPALLGKAEDLLAKSGPALILHERSPNHAGRIARELLRQRNKQYAVGGYGGQPPAGQSAIIISPASPGAGWRTAGGYWLREWDGPPQIWVVNRGDVYRDTEPLMRDLLSCLGPEREEPLPYPDANLDLVSRWGEPPTGEAEVSAAIGAEARSERLALSGGRARLKAGATEFVVQVGPGEGNVCKLTVTAGGGRKAAGELRITFPEGWWLVLARDMTGKWDRVRDPVEEHLLPNGGIALVYHFRPGPQMQGLTFDLARLKVAVR